MTWSLVTYIRNGTDGLAILRDDGTLATFCEVTQRYGDTVNAMRRLADESSSSAGAAQGTVSA
jgi:hypothetical protein